MTGEVRRLWATPVALGKIAPEDHGVAGESAAVQADASEPCVAVELRDVLENEETMKGQFLRAMRLLDDAAGQPNRDPVEDVSLSVERWAKGHEVMVTTSQARYVGWYVLAGRPSEHADSGAISVLDPRAGSASTAQPGLPWGRALMIEPSPGNFLVIPGWLAASILPLEDGQQTLVVKAESQP